MTFYEKVLLEYENSTNKIRPYLCDNSKTFFTVWTDINSIEMKTKIIKHANEFLIFSRHKYKLNFAVNSIFIFNPIDSFPEQVLYCSEKRNIRIDFLNWAVKNNLDI